jgi:DNA-binding response OmpR family regulator
MGALDIAAKMYQERQSALNVLLIEDNDDDAILTTRILRNSNFRVSAVHSGEEGINTLSSCPEIALAFIDLNLPGLCGLDTAKSLLALKPTLSICILSACDNPTRVQEVLKAGFVVVPKPLNIGQLSKLFAALNGKTETALRATLCNA